MVHPEAPGVLTPRTFGLHCLPIPYIHKSETCWRPLSSQCKHSWRLQKHCAEIKFGSYKTWVKHPPEGLREHKCMPSWVSTDLSRLLSLFPVIANLLNSHNSYSYFHGLQSRHSDLSYLSIGIGL